MNCHPVVRPGFHPLSIALMVLGFVVAWPLGLAMLAYMIWGERILAFVRGLRDGYAGAGAAHRDAAHAYAGFGSSWSQPSSGNAAFDEYRRAELERLAAERRRLDEERRAFEEYANDLRRARDKEEFDRFMADRRRRGPDAPTSA